MKRRTPSKWQPRPAAWALVTSLCGLGSACAPTVAAQPYPSEAPAAGEAEAQAPVVATPKGVVRYFDREIDLRPFLTGFPARNFEASVRAGKLFFLDAREAYTLRSLDLPTDGGAWPSLESAPAISKVDWSKRSLWGSHYLASRNELWLHADANNDEKMNLWVIDLNAKLEEIGREPVQRTSADYVYGFGASEDERTIAYLPRTGTQAPYTTCLHLLDVQSGEDKQVTCDSPDLRFTWGQPIFSPDGGELYFNAQVQGDRTRVQLVRVDLKAKRPVAKAVTDPKVSRSSPQALEGWQGDRLLFIANDDGFQNLYAYSRKRKRISQITHYKEDIQGATVVDAGVFVTHGSPAGSTIELVDPKTGEAKTRGAMPGKVGVIDGAGERVLWTHRAPDVVFELMSTRILSNGMGLSFDNARAAGPDPALNDKMVQCRAEAVRIPTFDTDPATQQPRELHAFLLQPKNPLVVSDTSDGGQSGARPLAMIRSFYGGDNAYTRFDHIMCAAGITILSPAVRGSRGFGKDFAALNNRDLGGDEIVDLFYAARWLERRLGLQADQIGVYGRSHGGYATMRALTFDPSTNGRNENYDFGFGLADAGFSDIVAFHDATNIPDWVVLESGDPAVEADKARMLERSPVNGVQRLRAPIFLLHGEADWRVPVQGSRAFAEAARKLDKPVTYVEVPGQGHHVEGVERVAENFQSRFDFLMGLQVPVEAPAP